MSYRPFWASIRDTVYNFAAGLFRSQEQIDEEVETDLEAWGNVVPTVADVPGGFKRRRRSFYSHLDAIAYIENGGIPGDYVYIVTIPNIDGLGNTGYQLYIEGS